MRIYSTCTTCHLLLDVVDTTGIHPTCSPTPDPRRDLDDLYRQHLLNNRFDQADALETAINQQPPPRLLDAALHYASWGWPVFPLIPDRKTPLTRHGFKDATTDPDRIRAWWTTTPTANIGLPTGHAFDVIDVDAPAGWSAYHQMQDTDAIPDVHAVQSTAGAGLHLLIQPTGEGNRAGILPGVDYRGQGGYIVAAPSIAGGRSYDWRHRPSPIITAQQVAA